MRCSSSSSKDNLPIKYFLKQNHSLSFSKDARHLLSKGASLQFLNLLFRDFTLLLYKCFNPKRMLIFKYLLWKKNQFHPFKDATFNFPSMLDFNWTNLI